MNLDIKIGEFDISGLILTDIKDNLKIPIIVDYQKLTNRTCGV